jgi:soluble cytochrome b562
MTISSVSGSSAYYTPTTASSSQKQNTVQALQQLAQALQSGNLQGAQSAFSTLQGTLPASLGGTASAASGSSTAAATAVSRTSGSSTNPLATDMQTLSQALQSGNLSAAQSAFAKLEQDASSTAQTSGYHHHHHHGSGTSSSSSSTTSASNSASGSSTSSTTGTGTGGLSVQA